MGFQYVNGSTWIKKAIGSFFFALISLGLLVLQAKYINEPMILILGFIPVIVATVQGILLMKRMDLNYIYLEEDQMLIYRGPILPKEKVDYRYIDYCIEVHDYDRKYMTVMIKDSNKQVTIETDWLSVDDQKQLKKQLAIRTNRNNLIRTRTL